MKTQDKIIERVQIGLRISEPDYFVGLLYLLNCLFSDYFKYIDEEGRSKGIMLRYQEEINQAFLDYFSECMTEVRYEYCGRVVFLYRNVIYNEYKYMNKRLSPADRVIVIIKRILEFIYSKDEDGATKNVPLESINSITTCLYDNIRWKQKSTDCHRFIKNLARFFDSGLIGKQPLWKYSLKDDQERYTKRYQDLKESEVLMEDTDENEKIYIGL